MISAYLHSLIGGALIGLPAALYLLLDGRIAGVSGIRRIKKDGAGPENAAAYER
jgi:hypothetical protein